jgi:hypothetical protein
VRTIDAKSRLARTYVWWQAPEITVRDPHKLLCQILRYGRPEDYVAAVELWGIGASRDALRKARRGAIDAKSTHFWKLYLGDIENAERSV